MTVQCENCKSMLRNDKDNTILHGAWEGSPKLVNGKNNWDNNDGYN